MAVMLGCYLQTQTVYETKTDHVYKDFYEERSLFYFSNYPKDLQFYDLANKKLIGKVKDEGRQQINNEFVRLWLKMYSLTTINNR